MPKLYIFALAETETMKLPASLQMVPEYLIQHETSRAESHLLLPCLAVHKLLCLYTTSVSDRYQVPALSLVGKITKQKVIQAMLGC